MANDTIDLSVVVPAVNTLDDVRAALTALAAQESDARIEILLMNRLGADVRSAVEREFPGTVVTDVPPGTTIPEMRAQAFRTARAAAVAVIEDHVIVPSGWARDMLSALETSDGVVAGSVENAATTTLLDWACFLCEYSHCIPPIDDGWVEWLTGNNIVYRRALLERFQDVADEGKWENRLHDAFKEGDVRLLCRPEIVVGHKKHYTFGEYMSQRYLYARSYAGARVRGMPFAKRFVYGAAAFVLPPLLLYRTVSRIRAKRAHQATLLKSIPLIALFVVSWGVGEIVGYWFGAGDSLGKVC